MWAHLCFELQITELWIVFCSLAYLHEAIEPKVVHRDIKSSNILIDLDFNAKVSDFGLAKLLGAGKSHVTTRVMGTFGYVASTLSTLIICPTFWLVRKFLDSYANLQPSISDMWHLSMQTLAFWTRRVMSTVLGSCCWSQLLEGILWTMGVHHKRCVIPCF